MAVHDPLADLRAEIAAEEAALSEQEQTTQTEEIAAQKAEDARLAAEAEDSEAGQAEVDPDVEAQAKVEGKDDKKPAKKAKDASDEERMVPAARLNEYAVNNRKMAKQLEEMNTELQKLKNPPKPGEEKTLTPEEYRDQIRLQERANIRLEMQVGEFLGAGHGKYTKEAFDAACNKISELVNGPSDLIAIAMEATGSPKLAADALYLLGQNDAPEIEAFLALSPIRKVAQLVKLATARPSRVKQDDEKPTRRKVEEDDEPPVPLRPLKGNARIPEGLSDDVPEDVWFDRFEKQIMNKGQRAN